jgi:predicted DNA-binding protein (MmcQ/YjbR family)
MDREGMLAYLGGRPGAVEDYPFGDDVAVFKVGGYHLNKRHWNTIELDGSVPADELAELVDHCWELVVAKLPRRDRDALRALG